MSELATFVKKSHLEARDLLLYAFHPKRAPALMYIWQKRLRGNQPSTINLYETNLSSLDNLSDTICCGPWMAACSQYSFTCVRICLNMLTILLIIKNKIKQI